MQPLQSALCFLSALFGEQKIYIWLLSASVMTGFIVWIGIALSHYRFRRGYLLQGYDINALPYRAKWFPCGHIMALIFCLLIVLCQGIPAFIDNSWNWRQLCMAYLGIPLFLLLWGGYRYYHKSSWVRYQAMDFNTYEKDNLSVESINH